jgi:hypothetical protein
VVADAVDENDVPLTPRSRSRRADEVRSQLPPNSVVFEYACGRRGRFGSVRGVAATSRGLAVVRLSPWSAKVKEIVAEVPPAVVLVVPPPGRRKTVTIGADRITFSPAEFERLVGSARHASFRMGEAA